MVPPTRWILSGGEEEPYVEQSNARQYHNDRVYHWGDDNNAGHVRGADSRAILWPGFRLEKLRGGKDGEAQREKDGCRILDGEGI